jgi:hypothetical protein
MLIERTGAFTLACAVVLVAAVARGILRGRFAGVPRQDCSASERPPGAVRATARFKRRGRSQSSSCTLLHLYHIVVQMHHDANDAI